ncbi:MAG: peptidylprolyl isomerase [Thermoplasmata archaeon]|nr:peptidylprolyl isomerase [Thermoplasmata archaeon]
MPIKEGYHVKVEYTGTLEDGTLFDSTDEQGSPLEFQVGASQVIEGFEKAIVAMELNEEKEINLKPEDAYGDRKDDMVRDIPKENMPADELEEGMTLMATLPTGMQVPVTVVKITDDNVKIDMNHPLAGKALNFKLKVVEIKEGELKDCEPSCGSCCSSCDD